MKRVKACLNIECKDCKKSYHKECDDYCAKCGSKLYYVCKHPKCFKVIPDDVQENYCPTHLAERKDNRDKVVAGAVKVGSTLLAAVPVVGGIVRKK